MNQLTWLYPEVHVNKIPLPENKRRFVNSYLIGPPCKSLVLDTGFNKPECQEVFLKSLQQQQLNFYGTRLLFTHLHSDHNSLRPER